MELISFGFWVLVSDLPKSTNFDIGVLCPDIPESMRKGCCEGVVKVSSLLLAF